MLADARAIAVDDLRMLCIANAAIHKLTLALTESYAQWFNGLVTDTDKLLDILDEKNDIVDRPDAEELLECEGKIEFENGMYQFLIRCAYHRA